jgi:hypothetical protein
MVELASNFIFIDGNSSDQCLNWRVWIKILQFFGNLRYESTLKKKKKKKERTVVTSWNGLLKLSNAFAHLVLELKISGLTVFVIFCGLQPI